MRMQNTDTIGELAIEPIEAYLQRSICADKLALYQPIIDLIKQNQVFSVMDSINALVDKTNDQTPNDILDELNDTLTKYLKQLIAEFDIVCSSEDIIFLKEFYEILSLLDSFDQHETIINICNNGESTLSRLYDLMNLIIPFDEMNFYDRVTAVPLMFFDRLIEIHTVALNEVKEIYNDEFPVENLNLIRKIAERNPQSVIVSLIREQYIVPGMNAQQLTNMISSHFLEMDLRDNKRIATELITLYLLTGENSSTVLKTVQTHMEQLVEDINQSHGIFSVLQSTMSEIKAYD